MVISLLGTEFRVFLPRYFWGPSKSLARQGGKGYSGHIQLFKTVILPYLVLFLSPSALRLTLYALRVFPLLGSC